jgi:hypothetical protein
MHFTVMGKSHKENIVTPIPEVLSLFKPSNWTPE